MASFIRQFRFYFVYAGLFSLVINVMMLAPSLYMLQVYDRVLASQSIETLVMLTIMLAVVLLTVAALEMVRSRLLVSASIDMDGRLGPSVLKGLLENAVRPEKTNNVHGLRDVQAIKVFLTGSGIFALFDAPWFPLYLGVIYLMHPLLFWIAFGGAIVMFGLAIANERATRVPLEKANDRGRQAGGFVEASLRNAEVVQAMGMLQGVSRRWHAINNDVLALQTQASDRAGVITGTSKFVRQFLQSLMLGAGAYLVIHDHTSSGVMIAATILMGKALAPVETAIATWKGLIEARAAYRRLSEMFAAATPETSALDLPSPQGRLEVERATFGFKNTNKAIIKGISFSLRPGEVLGVVGPSASGKSTLARMITGIWPPVSGNVRLDAADIAGWDREKLSPYIGYLPQDVELFAGTVAENIARLNDPAERSADVVAAAQRAGVHEMILRLPNGYDTEIGPAGAVLSGGQRQRIALARALFGAPRLVVLDEPNANLDTEGEEALLKALLSLKGKATTVVITHKPSLLAHVDTIMVLQDGNIALVGPRTEVLTRLTQPATPMVAAVPAVAR